LNKEPDDARKRFEKALELNPESQEALFSFARLEQSLGSLDKAIEKYETIREANPDNLRMALLIAALYETKGDHKKSKDVYEEILAKNPNVSVAANNLAFYYAEHEPTEENLAKAEKLVLPLTEKHKEVPSLVDTAAWVYYRKGEFAKARDLLMKVEEKGKDIPEINYHLGMVYLELGEQDKAESYLRLALNSERDFSGKEEAQRIIGSQRN
jgi:tetratricopeptide (TPR) repeat protein